MNENAESLDHALEQVAKLNFLTVLTFDPEEGYNAVIYAAGKTTKATPATQRRQSEKPPPKP